MMLKKHTKHTGHTQLQLDDHCKNPKGEKSSFDKSQDSRRALLFWLGTTCTEGPIGRQLRPVAALGVFPTLPGPNIIEPEAAVATTPAAFAKAVGLVVFGAKFDAETEDCFTLFAEIKGEDL